MKKRAKRGVSKRVLSKTQRKAAGKERIKVLSVILIILLITLGGVIYLYVNTGEPLFSPSDVPSGLQVYYNFDNFSYVKSAGSFDYSSLADRVSLGQRLSSLNGGNLPTVLGDGVYVNNLGQETKYTQTIVFSDSLTLRNFKDANNNSVFGFNSTGKIFDYLIGFNSSVSNLMGSYLRVFGRDYYILGAGSGITLCENITNVYLIQKSSSGIVSQQTPYGYIQVSDLSASSITLTANGDNQLTFGLGGSAPIEGFSGYYVGLVNLSQNGSTNSATLAICKNKIDLSSSGNLTVNGNVSSNFSSVISGNINSITISYYNKMNVYSGNDWTLPVFGTFKMAVGNFVPGDREEIKIKNYSDGVSVELKLNSNEGSVELGLLGNRSSGLISSFGTIQFPVVSGSVGIGESQILYTSYFSTYLDHTLNAQTIKIGTSGDNESYVVNKVGLLLGKSDGANCTADLLITGVNSSSGLPDMGNILSSNVNAINCDNLTSVTGGEWKNISINPFSVQQNGRYALVVNRTSISSGDILRWYEKDANNYLGGEAYRSIDGISWTPWASLMREFAFITYKGAGIAGIEKYFVASVYNSSYDNYGNSTAFEVLNVSANSIILRNKATGVNSTLNVGQYIDIPNGKLNLTNIGVEGVMLNIIPDSGFYGSSKRIYSSKGMKIVIVNNSLNLAEGLSGYTQAFDFVVNSNNNANYTITVPFEGYASSEAGTRIARNGSYVGVYYSGAESYAPVVLTEVSDNISSRAVLKDLSNSGNSGSFGKISFVDGKVGKGVTLSSNGYVSIPAGVGPTSSSYSISAYFKPASSEKQVIVAKTIGSYTEGLTYNNGIFSMNHYEMSGNVLTTSIGSSDSYAPGNWYLVNGVVDRSANKVYIYVNGQSKGNITLQSSNSLDYSNVNWNVGVGNASTGSFISSGIFDEVAIWNRALNANEITQLYSSYVALPQIQNVSIPSDCTNASINASWNSIFNRSFSGVRVVVSNYSDGGSCKEFIAYVLDNSLVYLLHGVSGQTNSSGNVYNNTKISAVIADFNNAYVANLTAINNISEIGRLSRMPEEGSYELLNGFVSPRAGYAISSNLGLAFLTDNFDIIPTALSSVVLGNSTSFENSIVVGEKTASWVINSNYSYAKFSLERNTLVYSPCVPIWGSNVSACQPSNTRIRHYFENGTTCGATAPADTIESCTYCAANWTSAVTGCVAGDLKIRYYWQVGTTCNETKANETAERCDFDGNNLIGTFEDVVRDRFGSSSLRIDDSAVNYSRNYTGTYLVQIREGNLTRLEFDYEFNSTHKLNLAAVNIQRSSNSASYGYMIIQGLNNISKTITMNRETSSNRVCILDSSGVSGTGAFTSRCNDDDETLLNCNGVENSDGFSCDVSDDGDYFVVSGLMHSAVKEFVNSSVSNQNNNAGSNANTYNYSSNQNNNAPLISNNNNVPQQLTPVTTTSSTSSTFDNSSLIFWIVVAILIVAIIVVFILLIMHFRRQSEAGVRNIPPSVNYSPPSYQGFNR